MDQEARPWSAVARLKKRHDVNRVVMVGHSGVVVISGVMLDRGAPLVDVAIPVSCPCDIARWRFLNNRQPFAHAESPVDYLSAVPKTAKIYALTGEWDRNTWPDPARDYVWRATGLGLDASFHSVEKAGHGFYLLDASDEMDEALWWAIKSRWT